MHLPNEIVRQPEDEERERIAISGKADGKAPDLAVAQQVTEKAGGIGRGFAFLCGTTRLDIVPLLVRQLPVGARITVEHEKQREIDKADDRRRDEAAAPAEMQHQEGDGRNGDDIGKFRGCIEQGRRQSAFMARKPVAGRFRIGRKAGRLGHAEQHARQEKRRHAGGKGGDDRSNAPGERAPAHDLRHTEAVEQHPDRDLQKTIGPAEGAEQQAHFGRADAEFVLDEG